MARKSFLRVLDNDAEFSRLKADFNEARQSGKFLSLRTDDPCAGYDASPPTPIPMLDLEVDRWRERGYTLEHALRESVKHGLLSAMPSHEAIRQVVAAEGEEIDVFHHWFALMRSGRRALMFDTETSTFPNRHDALILKEFGRLQPKVFHPADAAERWHAEPPSSAGHYDVAFKHAANWYHFVARNLSDWFDVDAVLHAISAAMADAGVAESFQRISTDSQGAYFVLATPRQIESFSISLRRPLDSTANAAFRDLPAELPTVPLFPSARTVKREVQFLDLACRLAKGQRVLVIDTPDGRAAESLVALLEGLASQHPDLALRLFSFGTELKASWSNPIPRNVTLFDVGSRDPTEQLAALGMQMRDIYALVAGGQDVLVFVSWLSRLGAPAGGVTALDLGWFKEFFGTGRNCGSGSLTMVASVPNGQEHPMDSLLIQELGRMANAELWFSTDLAKQTRHPPVDFRRSCVQREDLLFTEAEKVGRSALKAKVRTIESADVAAYVWSQLELYPSADDLLNSLAKAEDIANSPRPAEKPRGFWRRLFGVP